MNADLSFDGNGKGRRGTEGKQLPNLKIDCSPTVIGFEQKRHVGKLTFSLPSFGEF